MLGFQIRQPILCKQLWSMVFAISRIVVLSMISLITVISLISPISVSEKARYRQWLWYSEYAEYQRHLWRALPNWGWARATNSASTGILLNGPHQAIASSSTSFYFLKSCVRPFWRRFLLQEELELKMKVFVSFTC